MAHVYNTDFFDYIDTGSRASARALIAAVQPWLRAESVADFGCGRGAWLAEWQDAGVEDVCGLDGDYVDRTQLAIPEIAFRPVDLTKPQDLGRRFDLAQSLEVGEHLPEGAAQTLVASMCAHADRIVFSAAVRGQGGEFHVNEQPLSFWQDLFAAHGYAAFDCIRPALAVNRAVEPWYRYNAVFYANRAGQNGLPDDVLASRVEGQVTDAGDLPWRLRKLVVSALPRPIVTSIAKGRAAVIARRARKD